MKPITKYSFMALGMGLVSCQALAASDLKQVRGQCGESAARVEIELGQGTDYFSYRRGDDIELALPEIEWKPPGDERLDSCRPWLKYQSRRRADNQTTDLLFTAPGLRIDKIIRTPAGKTEPQTLGVGLSQRHREPQPGQTTKSWPDNRVNRIRIGNHPGFTRIVLDLSSHVAYQTEQAGDELIVLLPDTQWRPLQQSRIDATGLWGYRFENQRLHIKSKHPLTLLRSFSIPSPEKKHRLVFDLASRN